MTIKMFIEKNSKKGVKRLEQKINDFYKELVCKKCCYTLDYTSNKRTIGAIFDYELEDHLLIGEEEIGNIQNKK